MPRQNSCELTAPRAINGSYLRCKNRPPPAQRNVAFSTAIVHRALMWRGGKILRCHMPRHLERSEYCRHQAEECASRATITHFPEVKDAYLQLELAWRQLVPDFDPVPNILVDLEGADSGQPVQSDPPAQNTEKSLRRPK
jgi:hypothetical protein